MQKISSFHLFIFETILESRDQSGPDPFLTMLTQTFFDQLLIYVNLHRHAKKQTISLICSGNMIN